MPTLCFLPPTPTHPFAKSLSKLITDTVPSNFTPSTTSPFLGHVALLPALDPAATYKSDAQTWLDSLRLPEEPKAEKDETVIEFMELETGDGYEDKLRLRAKKDGKLLEFAALLHQQVHGSTEAEATEWAQDTYDPHLSLLHSDVSASDASRKMGKVEIQLGFEIGDLFACCGGQLAQGGRLAVVDFEGDADVGGEGGMGKGRVVAERKVGFVVWKAARALV